jgi:co-chaperonin GroES (HSP10)
LKTNLNTSGLQPVEFRVLVLPDEISEKVGSIFIPDAKRDKDQFAQFKGTLIAVGGRAFEDWGADRAKLMPGVRVLFARYAGKPLDGADGKTYRVVSDKDISVIVTDEAAQVASEKAA